MNQWVCFKLEWNADKSKHDKVPYNPVTGYKAKANDSTTWTDYETAAAAVQRGAYDGIGFEFANGIFGVDLDHVVNIDGTLTAEAQDIIDTLDSYTEYSPSGTGAHIICVGSIPPKDRRNGNVEMYSDGRFFTVTGNVLGQPKEVQERTAAAATVHAKYLKRETPQPAQPAPQKPKAITDTSDILSKAFSSKNGAAIRALYNGDTSANGGDQSAADQALINHLAYWTNGNAEQMDRLFRQSGLMRDKWDERHGADTYGRMTINKALESFTPYTPSGSDYKVTFGTPPAVGTPQPAQDPAEHEREYPTSENPQPDNIAEYLERTFTDDIKRFESFKNRKTGFDNLDRHAGGLYPGLYVIGSISSAGKTTFIHQMADQLAEAGDHILFFSLEQSRLEMVTKSLSRITARHDTSTATSAIRIRGGGISNPAVIAAAEEYSAIAKRVSVIECNFNEHIESILDYVKKYMGSNPGIKPVVIVDYLQIIPPSDPRQDIRTKVDNIVRGLKKIQSENDLVIIVVSSINRSNYLYPIDFESFKESGGIEYTADVIWGLQLQILNDEIFESDKKIKEKREMVRIAKKATPRKMELICLKNRYGISSYKCGFNYYPQFDLFIEDNTYAENNTEESQPSSQSTGNRTGAKGKTKGSARNPEVIEDVELIRIKKGGN